MPTQAGRVAGIDGHGRWGWCSDLPGPALSEGALLDVALKPGWACAGGGNFGLRGAIVHSGWGQWVGKGIVVVAPPLCATQKWCLACMVSWVSSANFPNCVAPHSYS